MQLADYLSEKNTLVDVQASTKTDLLSNLCARAAVAASSDAKTISCEILKREGLGSTGVGGGVAIPHARIPGLKSAFGVLARLQKSIDFEAIDGEPVDIVFLLLLPTATSGEDLNVLAAVARRLRNAEALRALRQARNGAAFHGAMVA
ncbi:PTS system nitrogen regulatory IIA component [Nitrobacter vulgaris]|uniref:PTS sugar transporter subunit IIA n=1 Tax=Nitrobacter vulgaris TaxID=29421 RepID=UPI002857C9A8|nr:PTS sugar transporter subunit IIA [Nitrobacter vulgaris]MDR6304894.1 PTS system nitrogen regulatory IIA component [Nitrobacter vulgaris]